MISDNLLGKVINESILNTHIKGNTLWWQGETVDFHGTTGGQINIYELAHKCKEWAYSKGYYLHTTMKDSHITHKLTYKVAIEPTEYAEYAKTGNTEPEAVFAACQWILDEITKENG